MNEHGSSMDDCLRSLPFTRRTKLRTLALMGWGVSLLAVFPNLTGQRPYQVTRQNYSVPQQIRWKQTDDRNRAIAQIGNRRSAPSQKHSYIPTPPYTQHQFTGGGDGCGFSDRAWEQIRYFGSGVNPPERKDKR